MSSRRKDIIFNLLFKRALHFFPLLITSLWFFLLYQFLITKSATFLISAILAPYLVPLICFKLLVGIYPIREGASYIGINEKVFSPWLFAFRIQQIYIVFPQLERLLFFLPGMYATWLRMWGSKVGKNVLFVPNITLHDRAHLELGDNIVFGDRVYLSPHVLEVKNGRFMLYLKKIKIGHNVFVGAMTKIGPGCSVAGHSKLPAGTHLTINQCWPLHGE